MNVIDARSALNDFLHFVSTQKTNLSSWQFFHIDIQDPEKKLNIDEVEQFLYFHVQNDDAWLLKIHESEQLLLFTHKNDSLALSKFEKEAYENFADNVLRIQFRGFDGDGLEKFSSIISPLISPDEVIPQVMFKRMRRLGNCILVLDDDPMVIMQMEKIISGYGHIVTLQEVDNFFESYKEYAPDLLFLDIHLKSARGNEILKDLKTNVDPYAHVVMISSDTQKEMVMDIKSGGANGFVVKPLSREKLFQQIMKAPTITKKI
ncbi:MAG: response regulator [Alphaproteobacteria bacterium]